MKKHHRIPRHNGLLDTGREWLKKRAETRAAREAAREEAERLEHLSRLPIEEEVRLTQAKHKQIVHEDGERVVMLEGRPVTTRFQWRHSLDPFDVVRNRRDPTYLGQERMVSIVPYGGRWYAVSTTVDPLGFDETHVFPADAEGDADTDFELAAFRPHNHEAGIEVIPTVHARVLDEEARQQKIENPTGRPPPHRNREYQAGAAAYRRLSRWDKDELGDQLVLGEFDWMDWFSDKPHPDFLRGFKDAWDPED